MKEFNITCDSATGKIHTFALADELEPMGDIIVKKYSQLPFDFWLTLRCLPADIGRKSIRRYYKKENAIGMDITVSEEDMRKVDKSGQRRIFGNAILVFFEETVHKYKKDFLELHEEQDSLIADVKEWLMGHGWLAVDS